MPRYLLDSEEAVVRKNSPYWLSDEEGVFLFTMCVLESGLPRFRNPSLEDNTSRIQFNIAACCNLWIEVNFMKENIVSLQRLDLEQAAAVVISAIRNDATIAARGKIVESLIKELDETMLVKSCMWLDAPQKRPNATINNLKLARLLLTIQRLIVDKQHACKAESIRKHDPITD